MAYYPDLSPYEYSTIKGGDPSKTLSFGWLDREHKFETEPPAEWLIEKLWAHCLFAVNDYRGIHDCNLRKCTWLKRTRHQATGPDFMPFKRVRQIYTRGVPLHPDYPTADDYINSLKSTKIVYMKTMITVCRHRRKENLGYSEIRIMGENDIVYAAPNLVFHYVTAHHYKIPDEVIHALKHGPCPPEQEYFDRLRLTGVSLSFVQCMTRGKRAGLKKGEWKGVLDTPTGPVRWIPQAPPRPASCKN